MEVEEVRDMFLAWMILSLAFANLIGSLTSIETTAFAFFTAGIGFLVHELAHKYVAREFGFQAVFEADYRMLGAAFVTSFFSFIFAVPGVVRTYDRINPRQKMLVSVAGPLANIVLALMFLTSPGAISNYGFQVNAWLALVNMIPVAGLDGESVFRQNKTVFGAVTAIAAFLTFLALL